MERCGVSGVRGKEMQNQTQSLLAQRDKFALVTAPVTGDFTVAWEGLGASQGSPCLPVNPLPTQESRSATGSGIS